MTCAHVSISSKDKGRRSKCLLCNLDIIFDGSKWIWLFGIGAEKRRRLITMFEVDRITGAHP